ncbi:AMP-binding protein [Nocardia sp. SC052]|uniref:AMP-binding protein n=1 Tax=Nocardia sichangensis TaxID=3385975 RepID=UPI0039A07C25
MTAAERNINAPIPADTQTVASLLSYWEENTPDAPFLLFLDDDDVITTLDFAAAADLSRRGSAVLSDLGVHRGDRFAVVVDNCPEFFACWFAAARIGAIMVPVSPQSSVDDLDYVFTHALCRAVICGARQELVVRAASRAGQAVAVVGADYENRSHGPVPELDEEVDPQDPLAVLYTSGTTSRPKGVVVTHAAYLAAGYVVARHVRLRAGDRWLISLPLFHANAQYYCAMSALTAGASVAVTNRFSASRWPAQAERLGATLASLFAAPIRMILARTNGEIRGKRLRATLFAQNLSDREIAEFETRFGCALIQIYGMTETVVPPLMNPLYGHRENMTLGLPTPAVRLRIVDSEGEDVSPGEVGELLVGGEPGLTLMSGYLHDPIATITALRGGWLHTGDLVRALPNGFVAFHDRVKDMIKRSGENVAAAEVEWVLNQHVAVFESAVVGVPDPIRDEAIKAVVVLRDDADIDAADLARHCAGLLPRHKLPDYFEFVDSLPRTSVGKVKKHLLRDSFNS